MATKTNFLAVGFILSCFTVNVCAQGLTLRGGRGLIHLSSAWNLEKGAITVNGYTATFFKNAAITAPGGTPVGVTFWDVQGLLALHYASGKHVEWIVSQIVYQDNHKASDRDGFNSPDDLLLGLKIGSVGSITSPVKFGLTLGTRIPVASKHNLILEPYSGERVSAGFTAQLSYSHDLLVPEQAPNFHLNFGFWYYNDTGTFLVGGPPRDRISVLKPTTEFIYGLGIAFPIDYFDLTLELIGNAFLRRPPVTAYGREDFIYLTPGVKYRPSRWISFLAGIDLRLSDFDDTTLYRAQGTALPRVNDELPNYPFWRLRFGTQIHLRKAAPHIPSSIQLTNANNGKRKDLKRQKEAIMKSLRLSHELAEERLKTESAEAELERIREERKRLEAVIERLKRILELDENEEEKELTNKKP